MKILFVCRGNVGRSQMAEAIFKKMVGDKHVAVSAGVEAMGGDGTDLDGMLLRDRATSEHTISVLKEIGIDVSNNYIKRLTPLMVQDADKVVVILKPEAVPEFLRTSEKVVFWDIGDPDAQTLEFHVSTRDGIKKLVEELVEHESLI